MPPRSAKSRITELPDDDDDGDVEDDEEYDDSEEDYDEDYESSDGADGMPNNMTSHAQDFFQFGNSLTVKGRSFSCSYFGHSAN